ncbi:uncharacterized protein C8Q71DRAFT_577880 [Rhodofomes roseus]|uniref:Uncharacterized protein n=1 Tax=Rhodofomes roseus TaxID=34475 RepID=A0ABQ8JWW5_9APHY|nr:uncharacterized protein C8Q71DRAFT_577880 [Rhodofomes roseus]KAH9828515.1 hypothetical protein C8Q71DRAFT_577880 [Rhodofomes roseus]
MPALDSLCQDECDRTWPNDIPMRCGSWIDTSSLFDACIAQDFLDATAVRDSYNASQQVLAFSAHRTTRLSSAERFAMIDCWKVQRRWNSRLFGTVTSLDFNELPITDPVEDRLWHLNAVRIACKGQRRFVENVVSVIGLNEPAGSQVEADLLEESLRAAKEGFKKFALCEKTLQDLVLDLLRKSPHIKTSGEVPPRDDDDIDKPAEHVSTGSGVNVGRIEPVQGRSPGVDTADSNDNVPGSSAVPRASSSQLDRTGAGSSSKTKKQTKKGAASGKIVSTTGPATRAKSKAKESTPPVKAIPNRFNFQSNPRS